MGYFHLFLAIIISITSILNYGIIGGSIYLTFYQALGVAFFAPLAWAILLFFFVDTAFSKPRLKPLQNLVLSAIIIYSIVDIFLVALFRSHLNSFMVTAVFEKGALSYLDIGVATVIFLFLALGLAFYLCHKMVRFLRLQPAFFKKLPKPVYLVLIGLILLDRIDILYIQSKKRTTNFDRNLVSWWTPRDRYTFDINDLLQLRPDYVRINPSEFLDLDYDIEQKTEVQWVSQNHASTKLPDIVLVIAESLRGDVVTEETMPLLSSSSGTRGWSKRRAGCGGWLCTG